MTTTESTAIGYSDLTVWDDEDGERYYLNDHVPARRAIAAVNRFVRESCGRPSRDDFLGDVALTDVRVSHTYWRPEPTLHDPDRMVLTSAQDLWGKPFTEVSL